MTKESGEVDQSAVGIDALAVPAQQRGHCKRVPQIMHPGRRYAQWDMKIQPWHEGVERMTDCPFVDAASFREGKQRYVRPLGTTMAFLYVAFEAFREFGPHRHDATLAELCIADEQRIADEIEVAQLKPGDFANTQSQPIKQSEYHLVYLTSMGCPRSAWKFSRNGKQAPGVVKIKQVSPIFRASLVQTGLWPPPLRSGGETPPLAPCYPRLRQVAFGMYMPRFNADVQRPTPKTCATR
jgi:hypothetical protein